MKITIAELTIHLEETSEVMMMADILECAQPHFRKYLDELYADDLKYRQEADLFLSRLLEI